MEVIYVQGGETVLRQRDPGDALYVLLSGRLRAGVAAPEGGERPLREIRPGESIGELSLLTGEPRSVTVRAIRDSELARLSKDAFNRLCDRHPSAMLALAKTIAMRLRDSHQDAALGDGGCTVAVVPLAAGVPYREFTARLTSAFDALGTTRCITSDQLDDVLEQGAAQAADTSPAHSRLLRWLGDLEASHRFLVYQGEWKPPVWTQRCIRQADRILLLAAADGVAAAAAQEAAAVVRTLFSGGGRPRAHTVLVMLHRFGTAPFRGTEEWLRLIPADHCHHIALTEYGDYARLVRFLTGRATGLVLGGGGARAFAQIGVIRALREAGVTIDAAGGTSMGAVIAAQYAVGMDYDTMLEANRRCWVNRDPLKNYTLPILAMTSGTRVNQSLKSMLGDAFIEDLSLPYFCVSTDLVRANLVVHHRGSLWKSVRASLSIPGIGPPLVWNGRVLVDGGVLNNLPVDVMKQLYDARVIAVDASPEEDFRCEDDAESVSGWRFLWDRIRASGPRRRFPTMFEVLIRTTMASSVRLAETSRANCLLYLHPPVDHFGLFTWSCLREAAEIGYRYTSEYLKCAPEKL